MLPEDNGLDLHGSMLLEQYHERLPIYRKLQDVAMQKLNEMIAQSGLELNAVESRIKSEASLVGKLRLKGHKYSDLSNITDIFGARIITFYNEDVDRIASMAETLFDVDWANSVDKRKMHETSSFGYNSLHYICKMPRELYEDPEYPMLNEWAFELQMRTALQHVWSAIQHDIGYKTDIETPTEYHRSLGRLAGMLELADNEFSRIRAEISAYRRKMRSLLDNGRLEEVSLDGDTFASYLQKGPFDVLNRKIAGINQAELYPSSTVPYLQVFHNLGMKTLADVDRLFEENQDDAYQLALYQLGTTDIDILADTIGMQNVVLVSILKDGGGLAGVKRFFDTVNGPSDYNEEMAQTVLEQASRLEFMSEDKKHHR